MKCLRNWTRRSVFNGPCLHPKAHYFILANKTDLEAARQVSTAEAEAFAHAQHTGYIETSEKTRMGLEKLEQKILQFTAHRRAKAVSVRATDFPQSLFGSHVKQEGVAETKTLSPRPEIVSTVQSPMLFVAGAKPTDKVLNLEEAKLVV